MSMQCRPRQDQLPPGARAQRGSCRQPLSLASVAGQLPASLEPGICGLIVAAQRQHLHELHALCVLVSALHCLMLHVRICHDCVPSIYGCVQDISYECHICMPRFCKSLLGFARLASVAHEPVTGREQTELRRLSMEREDITVRSAASAAPAPLLALSRGW